jgi:4-hydroxybenzoate-CoA ligase
MLMLDTVDFPIAFWGAIRAGVVPVPINTLLPPEQIAYILADSRAEALAIAAPLLPALEDALPRLKLTLVAPPQGGGGFADFLATGTDTHDAVPASPDEVAFWLYSSGSSTSMPACARPPTPTAHRCSASSPTTWCIRRRSCSSPMAWATQ